MDRIFLDLYEEALIISLDAKSRISKIVINPPPTPALTTAVIDTVLAAAVVVMTKLIRTSSLKINVDTSMYIYPT